MTDDDLKDLLLVHSAEIRRHFDIAVERLEGRFGVLSEAITQVDEKLERKTAGIIEKLDRTAAETQAMIKFSHAELDRRVRSLEESHRMLEETVGNLASRVERLETSAH